MNVERKENPAIRSKTMASVHSTNTSPEVFTRKLIFKLGYRYRLHVKKLPGSPDIVFPGQKKVIFVHGCFWHRHSCKWGKSMPKSNYSYWRKKFLRNVERDKRNKIELKKLGWHVFTVWECWTRKPDKLESKLIKYLGQ